MPECPTCGMETKLPDDVIESQLVDCLECGALLEIRSLDPIQLVEAPEEEEDWGE